MKEKSLKVDQPDHLFLEEVMGLARDHLRIAIIFSGNHEERGSVTHRTYHPRHWKSYENVTNDLRDTLLELGFRHVQTMPDDLNLVSKLDQIDLAWLNTGGMQGRNAMCHAAALLEMAGVPYIGHSPLNYALLDHKLQFKRHLLALGLPTPAFCLWDPAPHHGNDPRFLAECRRALGESPPWVVKPVNGRGSRFIEVVDDEKQLLEAVKEVYRETQNSVLVEEFMDGREFCVAGGPMILKVADSYQVQAEPAIFGFLEKFVSKRARLFASVDEMPITRKRAQPLDPKVDGAIIEELSSFAQSVCRSLSLSFLMRLDIRANRAGQLKILEANPKPDLKRPLQGEASLVAMGSESIKLSYKDLLLSLLADGLYQIMTQRPAAGGALLELIKAYLEKGALKDPNLVSIHRASAPRSLQKVKLTALYAEH